MHFTKFPQYITFQSFFTCLLFMLGFEIAKNKK